MRAISMQMQFKCGQFLCNKKHAISRQKIAIDSQPPKWPSELFSSKIFTIGT